MMDCEYSVPISNRFGQLADNNTVTIGATPNQPKPKPVHFVITKDKITALANINALQGKYNHQRMNNGDMKLFPKSAEAAELINEEVNKLGWYSHNNDKLHKYVMYRISQMNDNLLLQEINKVADNQVEAVGISKMTIKHPRYQGQCNYIVYFKKNPTLPVLREAITDLFGAIPSWAHYRSPKNPNGQQRQSRCTNCQRPGHGALNCHLPPKCVVCAGDHTSKTCPLLMEKWQLQDQGKEAKIDNSRISCANCGGNHTASFPGCPVLQKNRRPTPAWKRASELPQIPQPRINDLLEFPILKRGNRPTTNNVDPTIMNMPANSNNNNLFNISELQEIMSDIMSELGKCQNKQQQFNVMFSLAAKYVYNSP